MFSYKPILLSFAFTIFTVFFISAIQNNLWPVIFGIHLPLQLWIPCLVYWTLFRSFGSTIMFIYLITISISSLSSVPFSCLLAAVSIIVFILSFFKRVYYINWMFFSIGTALALLFFPALLWLFSGWLDNKPYIPNGVFWIGGALTAWLFSFPLLIIFQWVDQKLTIQLEENRT